MKKLLPGLCFLLILCGVGAVSTASANTWPWHRHHKDASKATAKPKKEKSQKVKKSWHRREKNTNGDPVVVASGPKSVGWKHPQPGPAGAGAQ